MVTVIVGQYKERGTDKNGRKNAPSSEKPEDYASEKYLFPYWADDASHKKDYENLMGCRGQRGTENFQAIYSDHKQNQKKNSGGYSKTGGPN
jgi:hypothetical protein